MQLTNYHKFNNKRNVIILMIIATFSIGARAQKKVYLSVEESSTAVDGEFKISEVRDNDNFYPNIWNRHVVDSAYSGADGVRLADVNNDNLMDIATGWEEGGYTKVYIHPGYQLVKQKWPSVIVGSTPSVEDAVFVDLDNNGSMDVVSSTEGSNKKIYFNWAPANTDNYLDASKWNSEVLPASDGAMQWMYAFSAQIDGENGMDIIVGAKNKGAKLGWFQAPKDARKVSDWKWFSISSASWIMSILLSDMDNDGDMDIVISDRKSGKIRGVRWLENPGIIKKQKKEWASYLIGCDGLEVMFMDLADLDGDGLGDAIVTEKTNRKIVFMKRLDKSGLNWKSYTIDIPNITGTPKAVKIGDINKDGRPDIVYSSENVNENKEGVFWLSYKNSPTNPVWQWNQISGPIGIKYDKIELIDLDGDGDLDVLTCEENFGYDNKGLGVIWYENRINEETDYYQHK